MLDEEFAVAGTLGSLGGAADDVDEVVVCGLGARVPAVGADVVAVLEGAGLKRSSDGPGSPPGRQQWCRPAEPLVTRPLSWSDAKAGEGGTVDPTASWLDVVTPDAPWSYGAIVPLADVGPGGLAVRVTLQVQEGRIGLALMRSHDELSLEIPLGASPDEQVIDLPFAVVRDAKDLLVRNHAHEGAARCRLTKLELIGG
jgi:hypothetical protein